MATISGFTPMIAIMFQEYWNREGLIDEVGEKKLAYYTLQKWYETYDGPEVEEE